MVAEWPGNWSLSALDRKFQNLLFSALEKSENISKLVRKNLPPHPQKAWLSPCRASSREIAGQTETRIVC